MALFRHAHVGVHKLLGNFRHRDALQRRNATRQKLR
jgi:hypothetical protein